jgi:NitT/TauT family transport system permease protein
MRRIINLRPGRGGIVLWGALPFLMAGVAYAVASSARLAANPNDKLLPQLRTFITAIERLAFNPDPRTGDYLMWVDTIASLERLGIGLAVATAIALVLGVAVGLIPYIRAGLSPFIGVISMIPPMAVLPVLFIVFGLDELSKVVLIVFGVTPFLIRDLALRVGDLPREQLIKAQTLGASTWQIVVRVVLPQMLPRLIDAVRLSLGPAWLFLISAEAIAATEGLGYRIFLVRRYMAMDVILPYVAWITLLAFLSDVGLRWINARFFPWLQAGNGQS